MSLRVLGLYYTHKKGGFCKRLYSLLNCLAEAGHSVSYLSLDPAPPTLSNKITFVKIPFPTRARSGLRFWLLFTLWSPIFCFYQALKIRPNRLMVFNSYYACILAPTKFLLKVPLILFLRSLVFVNNRLTYQNKILITLADILEKIGIASADKIVVMTLSMQASLERFVKRKLANVSLLPNDIEKYDRNASSCAFAFTLAENCVLGLYACVIDKRKNIEYLIDAMSLLQAKHGPHKFVMLIAGEGPLLQSYRKECQEYGASNVKFLGWTESIRPLFSKVDVMIHPSKHEGMSNSVLEALGAEVPVFLSDIPEHRELLPDDQFLFNLDQPSDLAAKLEQIIYDPSKLKELAKRSQELTNRLIFDWTGQARALVEKL